VGWDDLEDDIRSVFLYDDLILVAARQSLCGVRLSDGEVQWRKGMDGLTLLNPIQLFQEELLIRTQDCIKLYSLEDGRETHRWHFPGQRIRGHAVAPCQVFVALEQESKGSPRLLSLNRQETLWEQDGSQFVLDLRWESTNSLLYEMRIDGFGILSSTGERLLELYPELWVKHSEWSVIGERLYFVSNENFIMALRHPQS
jgi:hypothetical protein